MIHLKSIHVLALLILIAFSEVTAQNFEGVIYGATTYSSKIDSVGAEDLFGERLSLDETYIKDGFFKVNSSTDFMSMMLWRSKDTALYWFNKSSGDTLWFDRTNSHPAQIRDHYFIEKADSVAGYLCDALVVSMDNGNMLTYYYSPELSLDPEYYRFTTNSAKFQIVQLMKSVYLKLVIESSYGIVVSKALEVEWRELPDSFFDLPEHSQLKELKY